MLLLLFFLSEEYNIYSVVISGSTQYFLNAVYCVIVVFAALNSLLLLHIQEVVPDPSSFLLV